MVKISRCFSKIFEGAIKYSIHVSIIILTFAVIFGDFLWSDKIDKSVVWANSNIVENIDIKKVDTLISYLTELVPPLNMGESNQNVQFLTEGSNFLDKPSLPNTIISSLPREKLTTYTVSEGDTYWTIAYKFEIDIETLKWANNIEDLNNIMPGQELKILPSNGLLYTVQENDDLNSISSYYGVSKEKIINQNKLADSTVSTGQELVLPGAKKYRNYVYYPISNTTVDNSFDGRILTGTGNFAWPTNSPLHYITQYFGWVTKWYKHTGLDLDKRNGLDVFASDRGTVVATSYGWGGGYGNHIIIDHGNGYQTLYAHLSSILVNVGDDIEQGQKIAIMGSTGYSTGTHVHFEIRQEGTALNPLVYLP